MNSAVKKVFTTKVSLQSSNPTYAFPLIRLPRASKEFAGKTVSIYQMEFNGLAGFFIAPHLDSLDKLDKSASHGNHNNSDLYCGLIDQIIQKKPMGPAGFESATSAV